MADAPTTGKRPRLAIIGLDGATFDFMRPLAQAGKLPHLQALMDDGQCGVLRSIIPPMTGPAWTTILTGCNPSQHGIFGMQIRDPQHPQFFRSATMRDWQAKPLWDILNEQGFTTGFLGIPFSYPPPQVDGWMISGIMGTPAYTERMFNPPALFGEVTAAAGAYPLDPPAKARGEMPFDVLEQQVAWLEKASVHMLEHHPVDVFMMVENYTDHIGHHFTRSRNYQTPGGMVDLVEYVYRGADALVGAIRRTVGDDCPIVIVSDHGMGPAKGYINLEAAFPRQKDRSRNALRLIWRALVRVLPVRSLNRLRHAFLRRPKAGRTLQYKGATLTLMGLEGAIWVTAPDEMTRQQAIRELTEMLANLKDPETGAPIIEPLRKDQLFTGPAIEQAPDIIARPLDEGFEHTVRTPEWMPLVATPEQVKRAGIARAQLDPEGNHRLDGVFMTSVPAAISPAAIPQRLQDVAPYCLRLLLGQQADVATLFGGTGQGPAETAYSEDEQELVEQRLADLGYM